MLVWATGDSRPRCAAPVRAGRGQSDCAGSSSRIAAPEGGGERAHGVRPNGVRGSVTLGRYGGDKLETPFADAGEVGVLVPASGRA